MAIKITKKNVLLSAGLIVTIIFILGFLQQLQTSSVKSKSTSRITTIQDDPTIPDDLPENVVWMANHETKDLSQWRYNNASQPEQDSGLCKRPTNGVSSKVAHTGKYSIEMSINGWIPKSGCRQFRYPEIKSGKPYYYSAWIYIPQDYKIGEWSNIMQFKARPNNDKSTFGSKVFWTIRLMNRDKGKGPLYFEAHWDNENGEAGPFSDSPKSTDKYFRDSPLTVPTKKWVHLELYLKQSDKFDGQLIVWQDGQEIYNIKDIKTKIPDGFNSWSVNSYAGKTIPSTFTIYADDAVISTERIGPEFNNFVK